MSLLSDVIQIKKAEQETELRDISAISGAVENFINIRRQVSIDELNRINIESQIEARKPSATDLLLEKADVIDALETEARVTGDRSRLDQFLTGGIIPTEPRDSLVPIVKEITPRLQDLVKPAVEPTKPSADRFIDKPLPEIGKDIERNVLGEITEVGKVQLGLQEKKAALIITGEAAVDLQELKEGAKVRRNMSSGQLKLDLTLGEFFKFAKAQQELLRLPAGPLAGVLTKIISSLSAENKNKFLASFEGSRIELAAFVGRNAMPGTRAARIIDLFRKTTPSPFDTIASGIRNAAVSWGQTIDTDFGGNADEYIPGFSDMNVKEQGKVIREIMIPYVDAQIKLFEDTYTIEAYKISPEMFTEKDRAAAEIIVREDVRNKLRGE